MPIAAERQFLITVAGIDGFFAQHEPVERSAEATREWDGGSLEPEILTSPPQSGDLVVRRPFKPERDAAVLARMVPLVSRWRTSITVQPTDADLVAVGKAQVFTGVLIKATGPRSNASSGAAAQLELTFAVESHS